MQLENLKPLKNGIFSRLFGPEILDFGRRHWASRNQVNRDFPEQRKTVSTCLTLIYANEHRIHSIERGPWK